MRIAVDDLSGREITALLEEHVAEMTAISPPESRHALGLDALRAPEVTVWTVWDGRVLLGCGALRRLDGQHTELKSMRTATRHRGRGVGSALLTHLVGRARLLGYRRMSLETGSMPFFGPARALYRRHGFEYCAPFADYRVDPNSVYLTKWLHPV